MHVTGGLVLGLKACHQWKNKNSFLGGGAEYHVGAKGVDQGVGLTQNADVM